MISISNQRAKNFIGFFLKCENCENKPATIRLYNGAQERKVCFQCERDLVAKPQFKEWNKQFIPYSDLKKNGHRKFCHLILTFRFQVLPNLNNLINQDIPIYQVYPKSIVD